MINGKFFLRGKISLSLNKVKYTGLRIKINDYKESAMFIHLKVKKYHLTIGIWRF